MMNAKNGAKIRAEMVEKLSAARDTMYSLSDCWDTMDEAAAILKELAEWLDTSIEVSLRKQGIVRGAA